MGLQCLGHCVPIELFDTDREVIDYACWTLVVERNQNLPAGSESYNFVGLVLAHSRQSEDGLIKRNRAWQIGDLNAHVIDLGALRGRALSFNCRYASTHRSQRGERATLDSNRRWRSDRDIRNHV